MRSNNILFSGDAPVCNKDRAFILKANVFTSCIIIYEVCKKYWLMSCFIKSVGTRDELLILLICEEKKTSWYTNLFQAFALKL